MLVWALILLYVSTVPSGKLPTIPLWAQLASPDKWAHALVYGVFAVLLFLLLHRRSIYAAWWAIGLSGLYGTLMEFLQAFMARGRSFEVADMLANWLGALLAVLLVRYFTKSKTT